MKEIVVLSGKGGTGKTSIVGSLAVLARNKILVDCDVDAADLHLLLRPVIKEKRDFKSGKTAFIDEAVCTQCGLCQQVCRFKAITDFKVQPVSCEGCAFCFNICPVNAVTMAENTAGECFISNTPYGTLVHARLGIAQENSGKLVAEVRQTARALAEKQNADLIISDGPPGIGCPVISSLSGASLALLVTEPTLSGIHDLERVLGVCRHFNVPAFVCINKYDINLENTRRIQKFCREQGIPVVARIVYDRIFTEAMVHGLPVVGYRDSKAGRQIRRLWQRIAAELKSKSGENYADIRI